MLCASLGVGSSTGKYFVPALLYEVVLGSTLRKLCNTKSSTGKYFVLQSLHKVLPSTTFCTTKLAQSTSLYYSLYYKACAKYFPVLLRTTKLAQSTSQYYFLLQGLHRACPRTTLYYKACAKYFQYYVLPQSLHKVLPSTTLCTTKLAQSTSIYYFLYYKACTKYFQYYFVLQSLHKVLPCTTFCTTKLAQSSSQYYFVPVWILSSPAAATLQGNERFVLRLSSQIKPHATCMQLLQCVLQHHVANPHLFTHVATQHENIHADITLRSTTVDSKTPYNHAHTQTHPKQLQPTVTIREQKASKWTVRTRRTHEVPFIAGCSHFTGKNTRFRAPAFSPNQTPCNTHAAITMRFAASRR